MAQFVSLSSVEESYSVPWEGGGEAWEINEIVPEVVLIHSEAS